MIKLTKIRKSWFFIGLIAVLIAAPNSMIIRATVSDADPFLFNSLRFLIIGLVTLPIIIRYRTSLNKTNLKNVFFAAVAMTIATVSFVWALKLSQASYVSIFTLITPIVLIVYSAKFNKEQISRRAVAGISLAAAGAAALVLLPVAFNQSGDFIFYPAATFIVLFNILSFPAAVIFFKKSNEGGVPMFSVIGISAWLIFAVSAVCYLLFSPAGETVDFRFLQGVLYSGLAVGLIARVLATKSYEYVGAVVSGALGYLESLIAVLLPVFILGEVLSIQMAIGGVLILLGVYVVEHHKHPHHKHHLFAKHH